jgi:hypothetical protein
MPFYIGKKLDYLMNLTSTRNNVLAKALNFDSSHISRIRNGERGLPRQKSFIAPAAEFFARRIREPFQIKGAEDMICPGESWPLDTGAQAALIAAWLEEEDTETGHPSASSHQGTAFCQSGSADARGFFYYGNEGKRQAAERLLTSAAGSDEPVTLLLYSDEDMSWMTEDPEYFRKWAGLMMQNLTKGNRIRMIHNMSRNLGELMDALAGWIPLYLTGSIEPWYCPRIRDGLFHQTRFIIQGREAAFGGYTVSGIQSAYTVYTYDRDMLQLLEEQFNGLLQISKPLMQVFTGSKSPGFMEAAAEFMGEDSELLCAEFQPQSVLFYIKSSHALIISPEKPGVLLSVKDPTLLAALREFALRTPAPGSMQELKNFLS